eukprot:COSAG04_NODE_1485_length_6559_cov_7.307585_8_plen_102_part_00
MASRTIVAGICVFQRSQAMILRAGESVAQLKADVAALLDDKETDEAAKAGRAKELVGFALERGMHTAQGGAAAINQVTLSTTEMCPILAQQSDLSDVFLAR